MGNKNKKKRNPQTPRKSEHYIIYRVLLLSIPVLTTFYFIYRIAINHDLLVSTLFLFLPFFAGLFLESIKLTKNWEYLINKLLGSYLLSFIAFLPLGKEGEYVLEHHLAVWPFFFMCIYAVITLIFNKDKATIKLNELTTAVQSLSVMYWFLDYGYTYAHTFTTVLISIALLLSAFSLLQALTYLRLSATVRFILSIWSTIIALLFSFDYIYRVFKNSMSDTTSIENVAILLLQYFLLGASIVYIMRNIMLLAYFLPGLGFYSKGIGNKAKLHINRFSKLQSPVLHSVVSVIYALLVYSSNYMYNFLPRHIAIMFVFLTFPLLITLSDTITAAINNDTEHTIQ